MSERATLTEAEREALAGLAQWHVVGDVDLLVHTVERILADRLAAVQAERDRLLRERDNIGCSRFTCADNLGRERRRTASAEAKVERVKTLHETWKTEGWDYPEGAIYDLGVALDECFCGCGSIADPQPESSRAESAEAERDDLRGRLAAVEALCRKVIEVHAHVVMDTPKDRELHDRAIATFRAYLDAALANPSADHARTE